MRTNQELFNKLCIYLKFEGITKKQELVKAFMDLYPLGYFMLEDNCSAFIDYWQYGKNENHFSNEIFEKVIEIADDYHNENRIVF